MSFHQQHCSFRDIPNIHKSCWARCIKSQSFPNLLNHLPLPLFQSPTEDNRWIEHNNVQPLLYSSTLPVQLHIYWSRNSIKQRCFPDRFLIDLCPSAVRPNADRTDVTKLFTPFSERHIFTMLAVPRYLPSSSASLRKVRTKSWPRHGIPPHLQRFQIRNKHQSSPSTHSALSIIREWSKQFFQTKRCYFFWGKVLFLQINSKSICEPTNPVPPVTKSCRHIFPKMRNVLKMK